VDKFPPRPIDGSRPPLVPLPIVLADQAEFTRLINVIADNVPSLVGFDQIGGRRYAPCLSDVIWLVRSC
jgi:hypothetical protein